MNTYKKHGLTKEDVAVHNRDSWLRKPGTSLDQAQRREKITAAIAEQRGRNRDYGSDRFKREQTRDGISKDKGMTFFGIKSKKSQKSAQHNMRQHMAKVMLNSRYEKSLKEYAGSKDHTGGVKGMPSRGEWDVTLRKFRNN